MFAVISPSFGRVSLLAVFLMSLASNASAQTDGVWTEPGQRFSLEFHALGWSEIPASGGGEIAAIEHREFQATGLMRTCLINEQRQSIPSGVTQTTINAATTARGVRGLSEIFDAPIISSRLIDVDGIPVLDAVFGGSPHQHVRVFYLKDGADVAQIVVTCGATAPAAAEVTENIANLLDTLRINAR